MPPLLVTGPPCTGKTSVVRAVLDHRGCSYAYVNCAEVVQRRDLLEALVEQVAGGSRYRMYSSSSGYTVQERNFRRQLRNWVGLK